MIYNRFFYDDGANGGGGATDIDDVKLFEALSKKLGKPVTSWDDVTPPAVKTAEEIQAEKDAKDSARVSWALSNGKVTKSKWEEFAQVSANPEIVIYNDFLAAKKAEDKDADEADIKEEFETIKQKFGTDLLKGMSEARLKEKYPEIYSIDKDYDAYEAAQKTNTEFTKKYKAEAPVYTALNNEYISKTITDGIEIEIPAGKDGEAPIKFTYKPTKAVAEKVAGLYNAEETVKSAITTGFTKDKQEFLLKTALVNTDIAGFAKQIAEQATENREAIIRGIPPKAGFQKRELTPTEEEARVADNLKLFNKVRQAQLV